MSTQHHGDHEPPQNQDRVQDLLRRAGDMTTPPPASVWDAIRAETEADERTESITETGTGIQRSDYSPQPVHDDRGARPTRRALLLTAMGAAAAGALVAGGGAAYLLRDRETEDPGRILASAPLDALTASGEPGEAEVIEHDGTRQLRVDLEATPDAGDGYMEVWLLTEDVSGMITLGALDGGHGTFTIPHGVD
ncbi:MAG: anti-sigma factor, partial [Brachybacterium sp.]|nr:anti-sigma factor [Brachybacterium sp.]